MTKKDYELIAGTIRDMPVRKIRREMAEAFATNLYATNPRFDRARFIAACMGEDSTDMAGRKVRYSTMRPGEVAR